MGDRKVVQTEHLGWLVPIASQTLFLPLRATEPIEHGVFHGYNRDTLLVKAKVPCPISFGHILTAFKRGSLRFGQPRK